MDGLHLLAALSNVSEETDNRELLYSQISSRLRHLLDRSNIVKSDRHFDDTEAKTPDTLGNPPDEKELQAIVGLAKAADEYYFIKNFPYLDDEVRGSFYDGKPTRKEICKQNISIVPLRCIDKILASFARPKSEIFLATNKRGFSFVPRIGKKMFNFNPRMGKRAINAVTKLGKRSFSFMPRMGKRRVYSFVPRIGKRYVSFMPRMG